MIKNKATIIGAGMVGSTAAYSLIVSNTLEEVVLIDINRKLVESQVMDLQHSIPFWGYTKVKAGDYRDLEDSRVAVIACGASQKPGQTRLDLVEKNAAIVKSILPRIFKANPKIIVIMVTNPVDVLTYLGIKMFPKKKNQIIGSGTILDSARFRAILSEHLRVNPKSIHAYIVGEHGDSEVPLWSTVSIGNSQIDDFKKLSPSIKKKIFNQSKNAAYAIIEGKKATYYAIAAGIKEIVQAIVFNKRTVLALSHLMEGEYGIKDICLSLPVVIGGEGVVKKIKVDVSAQEERLLKLSAKKLKEVVKKL